MWSSVGLVKTDVAREYVATIFKVERKKSANVENAT
jgi:hypothetical protein